MNKEAYVKGFEEEMDKIAVIKDWFKRFNIRKSHEQTSKALQKAMKAAGSKWSKLSPKNQSLFLSTYMGSGDPAAKRSMRKKILMKV